MKNIFIHPNALCESTHIGCETKIWAFAHVLPNAVIGKNCNICDSVFIENDVIIGDNVTVKCGVQLWDGLRVEDDVFIGPNATFTNDLFPRSKQYPDSFPKIIIRQGASIGANATILPGITIGQYAMIGAGSVITKNVPAYAVVAGNPGRIIRYSEKKEIYDEPLIEDQHSNKEKHIQKLKVGGCEIWSLPVFSDLRGDLSVIEFSKHLPFAPKRNFFVYGVSSEKVRGEHAHKECKQFLFVLNGSVNVMIDDGKNRQEIVLSAASKGLYMPAGVWGTQYKFVQNSVLCVFASSEYDDADYIRDYSDFLKYVDEKLFSH